MLSYHGIGRDGSQALEHPLDAVADLSRAFGAHQDIGEFGGQSFTSIIIGAATASRVGHFVRVKCAPETGRLCDSYRLA